MKEKKKPKEKKTQGERKPNWKEYTATVEDIQQFLMDRVMLRHNVITGRVECHVVEGDPWAQWDGSTESTARLLAAAREKDRNRGAPCRYEPITDRIVNSLWKELSQTKQVNIQDIYRIIGSDFVPEFNPFQFYLNRLPR